MIENINLPTEPQRSSFSFSNLMPSFKLPQMLRKKEIAQVEPEVAIKIPT